MTDILIIRPSSLPGFLDCQRRAVAQLFRPMIVEAGYLLNSLPISIGAHVGTAVHTVAAVTLEHKIASGGDDMGNEAEVIDAGLQAFEERAEQEGCRTDDTTPDHSTAFKQISRMGKMYRATLGRTIKPVDVERRLEADVGNGFVISGQADAVAREPGRLRDLKTGTKLPAGVHVQIGTYSMLRRTWGHNDVQDLSVDYLPRVSIKKEQPRPEVHVIPIDVAEQEAAETVAALTSSTMEFQRRLADGDKPPEQAFRANPSSMLCSQKWCPAWNSTFCRAHAGAR